MLKKLHQHHQFYGIIGISLSCLIIVISSSYNLDSLTSIMLSIWCAYLFLFSVLHTFKGFKTSSYFMVFGFITLLVFTIGLYLIIILKWTSIQNMLVVPIVFLITTGAIRNWTNKIKDRAGLVVENAPLFDLDPSPSYYNYLVYPYIEEMSNALKYPPQHIKNIDSAKQKIRFNVLFGTSIIFLFLLIIIALEVPMPSFIASNLLTILITLLFTFIFSYSFYTRGFDYAFKFTSLASMMIPISIIVFQVLKQLYLDSLQLFWWVVLFLVIIICACGFLALRYIWRTTYNQLTLFKRKSKIIAFSNHWPISKPYSPTAITVTLKLTSEQCSVLNITQNRPADLHSLYAQAWALAGITLDETSKEVTYLFYAHPRKLKSIERYFRKWSPITIKIDSVEDPNFDQYKNHLPTKDEYFTLFNELALTFYHFNDSYSNKNIKVIFLTAFTDASQMDMIEPLFDQVDLSIIERHEPKFDEDGSQEYGGFILEGEIPTSIGLVNQMTKSIIDLCSLHHGELVSWQPVNHEENETS
jgi:hypothetical protein